MDHLVPPMADDQPMYEAMTTATWLAARTERLTIGHLVLCDAMREAPVLAKQAVTIDHASGGRFELGIGWGSVPQELVDFGITTDGPAARATRLGETLATLREFWGGRQQPTPLTRIPIVIGGVGPRTVAMVAEHADWWNVPINLLDQLDERRAAPGAPGVGAADARLRPVGGRPRPGHRAGATPLRADGWGLAIGTGAELVDQLGKWGDRGVERALTPGSLTPRPAKMDSSGGWSPRPPPTQKGSPRAAFPRCAGSRPAGARRRGGAARGVGAAVRRFGSGEAARSCARRCRTAC